MKSSNSTIFTYGPGDVVRLWGRTRDLRRVVDTPARRAYVTASGTYLSRATVDRCATLLQKANEGYE